MTASTTELTGAEVVAFATAVRAALSDLPPDELDELTDGLEADLTERAAEAPDAEAGLGDPVAYAEELRAAAGYPPRSARSHLGGTLPNLRTIPQDVARGWRTLLAERPLIASIASFFAALRPVWWVLRGLALYGAIAWFVGVNALSGWFVAIAFVVLSVQVGRGWMRDRSAVRWIVRVGSAVALLAAPFLIGAAANAINNAMYPVYADDSYLQQQGLTSNGVQVDNIYAYDAHGEPIDRVQLFDQNGEPLDLVGQTGADFWGAADGSMLVPSGDVPGRAGWNVFPLAHANSWADYEEDGMLDESEISQATFPFDHVKSLANAEEPADPDVPMAMSPDAITTPTPAP
jgi:hypothetical protein